MKFTVDRPELFPVATEIGLYLAESVPDPTVGPLGNPIETRLVGQEVDEDNEPVTEEVENPETKEMETVPAMDGSTAVVFEQEPPTRNYLVGAKVEGAWRFLRFAGGELGASLEPPARYPTHGV